MPARHGAPASISISGASHLPAHWSGLVYFLSSNGRAAELRNGAEEELVTLRAKLTKLEAECSELAIRLDAMKNSTCWRITCHYVIFVRLQQGFWGDNRTR